MGCVPSSKTNPEVVDGVDDTVPVRSFMEGEKIKWRFGPPDYDLVNQKYMAERSCHHAANSLEKIVENLVKTWEMEVLHKLDKKDMQTMDLSCFRSRINCGRWVTIDDIMTRGSYNIFLEDSLLYQEDEETFDSAHETFKTAFDTGFAWEVIEVYSGPPRVSFKWRHWTHWTGQYKGSQPTGELIEMFGVMVATIGEDNKIKEGEIYYDPNPLLTTILGGKKCPFSSLE